MPQKASSKLTDSKLLCGKGENKLRLCRTLTIREATSKERFPGPFPKARACTSLQEMLGRMMVSHPLPCLSYAPTSSAHYGCAETDMPAQSALPHSVTGREAKSLLRYGVETIRAGRETALQSYGLTFSARDENSYQCMKNTV